MLATPITMHLTSLKTPLEGLAINTAHFRWQWWREAPTHLDGSWSGLQLEERDDDALVQRLLAAEAGNFPRLWPCYPALKEYRTCMREHPAEAWELYAATQESSG